jgi:hypothetical protein
VGAIATGIPYAEPPIGPLRFEPTVLLTALASDTLDASNFSKSCLQPVSERQPTSGQAEMQRELNWIQGDGRQTRIGRLFNGQCFQARWGTVQRIVARCKYTYATSSLPGSSFISFAHRCFGRKLYLHLNP